MQKIITLCLLLMSAISAHAVVLTVSNYPPLPAQYTDLGAAMGAASNGDTIYVHGSPTTYPATWISKRLVLIGAGYNPKVDIPFATAITELSPTVASNGSTVIGFRITTVGTPGGAASDTLKNYVYRNCQIGSVSWGKNYENVLFDNCVFTSANNYLSTDWPNPYKVGMIIRNCIFSEVRVQVQANTVIEHCVFIGSNPSGKAFMNCSASTFSNNIFISRSIDAADATGCVFNNNLTFNCSNNAIPLSGNSGTGNIINLDPQFVNHQMTPPTGFAFSDNYRLQTTSPGHNAATNGTDLGVYGNNHTFSMTGEAPGIPVVRKLDIYNTTVPLNGTLDIRYKSSVPVND